MTDTFPDFATAAGLLFDPHIAYIKPTPAAEARRMGILPPGIRVPDNLKLYVLHASDGRVLGFTDDWESACSAALQNELTPLNDKNLVIVTKNGPRNQGGAPARKLKAAPGFYGRRPHRCG